MAGGLFSKMLGRLRVGTQATSLRALAATGNEAIRLRLVKESDLDQKTLEVLARRGPQAVRIGVANHPKLTHATADRLRRIDDFEFQVALDARFQAPPTDSKPATIHTPEILVGPPVIEESFNKPLQQEESLPKKIQDTQTTPPQRNAPQENPVVLGAGEYTENRLNVGLSISETNAPSLQESGGLIPPELELAYQLIASSSNKYEPASEPTNLITEEPSHEDVAEIILGKVFETIPSGHAADELLMRIATRSGAPKVHSLVALRDDGRDADEVLLIWRVRDLWNSSRGLGDLNYDTAAKLVSTYAGIPDEEEVLVDLAAIERNWRLHGEEYKGNCNGYIERWVTDYEAAYRGGAFPPIEVVLKG